MGEGEAVREEGPEDPGEKEGRKGVAGGSTAVEAEGEEEGSCGEEGAE